MNKIFIILILAITTGLAQAQSPEQILDKVATQHKKNVNYFIAFDYELNNPKTGVSQKETGEVYTAKKKYNLSLLGIKQIYNGKKLYTIDKETQEVIITNPKDNDDDLITPTKVLDMYKNGFKLSLDQKKTIKGNPIQYIKLVPEKKSDIKHYLVGVNTNNNTLYQYQSVNQENTKTTLTITKYLENLIIPKNIFKFNNKEYIKKGYFITE